jgi:hypothetical protein
MDKIETDRSCHAEQTCQVTTKINPVRHELCKIHESETGLPH